MVAQSREWLFFNIRFLFWYCFHVVSGFPQNMAFPVGNPLSGVLARLFLECLESTPLNSDYLAAPHISDILTIYLFSYSKT